MKRIQKTLILSTAFTLAAGTATAASKGDTYIGAQYSQVTYSVDGWPDFEPTMLQARAGYFFEDNFAIEGRVGINIGDDSNTINVSGTDVTGTVELDSLIGIYAIGYLPMSEKLNFYGFLGYNRADATESVSASGFSISGSDADSDIAYGVGAEISISKDSAINFEYGNFYDEGAYSIDALSIGYKMDI